MLTFSEAIKALEQGKVVRRSSWRNSDIAIFQKLGNWVSMTSVDAQSIPESARIFISRTRGYIEFLDQYIVYDAISGEADAWIPTNADMSASDWCIIDI